MSLRVVKQSNRLPGYIASVEKLGYKLAKLHVFDSCIYTSLEHSSVVVNSIDREDLYFT